MKEKKRRILLTKMGLDGHDRGIVNVARVIRDAGIEVIYLGRRQFPEQIIAAAIQEDVDLVGVSSLTDAHMVLVPKLIKGLREKGSDVPVILGGFIQPEDIPYLKDEVGVAEVFGIGTNLNDIVKYVKEKLS